ncbi:DUF4158 domain-containing protein [Streptomyces sp. NPDC060232]|uniref:DUF4158 domain-containing protein n=1 Tax=Streptomyces sp. NPDC060232 TaxID=3347079 RepID=UPI00365ACA77
MDTYLEGSRFPDLDEVPKLVVEHVRGLLELGDEVEPRHDSTRTAARQRDFVRERLGVVYDPEKSRQVAAAALYGAVQTKDNPADLINVALAKLVKARLELPGYTTLDEMTSAIRTEVNEEFFAAIVSRMDEVEKARLLGLLRVPAGARSRFDELKRPAKSPTISHLREHLKYLDGLELLGRTGMWLEGVPPGKITHFAGQAGGQPEYVGNVPQARRVTTQLLRRAAGSRSATCRATTSTRGRAYCSRERTEACRERASSMGVEVLVLGCTTVLSADELGDLELVVALGVELQNTVEHPRIERDPRTLLVAPRAGLGQAPVGDISQILPREGRLVGTAHVRLGVGDALRVQDGTGQPNRLARRLRGCVVPGCFSVLPRGGIRCCGRPGSKSDSRDRRSDVDSESLHGWVLIPLWTAELIRKAGDFPATRQISHLIEVPARQHPVAYGRPLRVSWGPSSI